MEITFENQQDEGQTLNIF